MAKDSTSRLSRQALLVGASGLVGRKVLELLLADRSYSKVHTWVRRPQGLAHAKLVETVVDFDHLGGFDVPRAEALFCCLGTTIKVAGSQASFRRVDHDYVLACARAARDAGARHLLMVSALGADAHSRVFYNRVKGETEAAVCALGYPSVTVVRPSLLAGNRAENRPGEKLALGVLSPLSFLIPSRYRPVADIAVARAMLDAAARGKPGVEVIESEQLQTFGR